MGLKYNWIYPNYDENFLKLALKEYNLSNNMAKILSSRNITEISEIKKYISLDFEEGYDPYLMYDMEKAVERINNAIENEEKILVYGDYDADGITSTVLLLETLLSLGADVSAYIPNRFEEGYGPNKEAFEKIIKSGISLIITVDNGIAGVEEVDFANELGCDVIITDHHKIQDTIPNAYAVIHPEHPKGNYPFGKLAGVGVAFKLAHALLDIYPDFLLDLVAIGTVADMVSLTDENRIFVTQGLKLLNENLRIGLKFLLQLANVTTSIDEQTIGFCIAPRLNAIGRISSAKLGLSFLMTEEPFEAKTYAEEIEKFNIQRKEITEAIVKDVISIIEETDKKNKNVIAVYGENYHEGVLGIVASNITEKYNKPVLIMNNKDGILKGSARSVYDFNIYYAMNEINELFTAFGGHSLAAGFSLPEDNIDKVEEFLDNKFKEYKENNELKITKYVDLITEIENISYQYLTDINTLKPFGMDFEKPSIVIKNANVLDKSYFGSDKQYYKMIIGDSISQIECISFKDNDVFSTINRGDIVDVLCTLDKNSFNGRTKIQAHIIDVEEKNFLFYDLRNSKLDIASLGRDCLKLSKDINIENESYFRFKDIDNIKEKFEEIYLLSIPQSKKIIDKLIELNPERIYLIFDDNNLPYYKHYKIDKGKLIKFFNLLVKSKNNSIELKNSLPKLLTVLETNVDSLKIMISIFQELELINFKNNTVYLNKNYTTVDLNQSVTFRKMNEIFEIEQIFIEKNISQINEKYGRL